MPVFPIKAVWIMSKSISIMSSSFPDKVTLVTGAASGIGRATAIAFAKEGATVVISDWSEKGGQETLKLIEKAGGKAIWIQADVSQPKDVKNLFKKILDQYDHLDCAFNNAGIEGETANLADSTEENWSRVIDINLKGVWLCMREEIAIMLKQKSGGAIVNCASIAGVVGFRGLSTYTASKHGVIGLTKTAALEYAKSNIRINAVCPGVIQTSMIERLTHHSQKEQEALIRNEPVGRMGTPEEIANAVLWLCSENASFVTGHPLVVDGGWVAQ